MASKTATTNRSRLADMEALYEELKAKMGPDSATPTLMATFKNRLASFTTKWPHHQLLPAEMAAAGFYCISKPASPDHVVCFRCGLELDGWSDDDKLFFKHAHRSKDCSWIK
ncbi:MAG: hypothetical protein M1836_006369 [Candelina mexicana]|nr:MAG: hypothetical protein M1836_006369 [Candelina mexicana]